MNTSLKSGAVVPRSDLNPEIERGVPHGHDLTRETMFFPPECERERIYGRDGYGPAIEPSVLYNQETVDKMVDSGGFARVFGF